MYAKIVHGLDIMDDIIKSDPFDMNSFNEFCEDLDAINLVANPELYLIEGRIPDTKEKITAKVAKGVNDAATTTGQAASILGDATDAGGSLISGLWKATIAIVGLIVKVIKWIITNLSKIPDFIARAIRNIGKIPEKVRNMIRGNIQLYITAEDVKYFYSNVFPSVKEFMDNTDVLSEGDMFTSTNKQVKQDRSSRSNLKDVGAYVWEDSRYKKMKREYDKLRNVKFEPSTVEMNDKKNLVTYFSADNPSTGPVKFTSLNGDTRGRSYLEALKQLSMDFNYFKDSLTNIQKVLEEKFDSRARQSFIDMKNKNNQAEVRSCMSMVSKVIGIIGDLIKYTIKDTKTIHISVDRIKEKAQKLNVDLDYDAQYQAPSPQTP